MVHLLSGMQYITGINQIPDEASAMGATARWKDGRNMPDLHMSLFRYGTVLVSVRLTLGTDTPETTRILGSRGIIEIVNGVLTCTPQRGIDTSPSYYTSSYPLAMRKAYEQQWHAENDTILAEAPLNLATTYHGAAHDDVTPHLRNFFSSVRSRKPVVEDALFGHHAAAACHMANLSYFHGKPISKAEALKGIPA
ncbi:MAG TPA: hypothetical protein VM554_14975 [Acidisarcina sp.]|nr:hypothetical protein [Acidisarcina sp.]